MGVSSIQHSAFSIQHSAFSQRIVILGEPVVTGESKDLCQRISLQAGLNLDYSQGTHALKGHGFSRAVTCMWRVGLQPLRKFAVRANIDVPQWLKPPS